MASSRKFLQPINLLNSSSDPSGASEGDFYYNTTSQSIKYYDGSQWNDVGVSVNVSETAPTGNIVGEAWFKSSTSELFIWDGEFWIEATSVLELLFDVSSSPPANPSTGMGWFDTDTNEFFIYDGTYWVEVASVVEVGLSADSNPTLGENLDANNYSIENLEYIDFNTSASVTPLEGRVFWNEEDGTLDIGLENGSVLQSGQEVMFRVSNRTASPIANGAVVYVTGVHGDQITVAPAIADGSIEPKFFLGIATDEIPVNDLGYVTYLGKVQEVSGTYSAGTVLYASAENAGELTDEKPLAPNLKLPIAFVVRQFGDNMDIVVRMTQGTSLGETDNNVEFTSLVDNDILSYSSASGIWTNQNLATAIGEVDGTGSGIDADLLDGQQGSYYTGYADSAVSTHNDDETNVHGIADTSALETQSGAQAKADAAESAAIQAGTDVRQFAADGSSLLNLPARVHPGEQLLKQAVWWIDSAHSSADGQEIQNLGWGGNALNAQLGSAPGADSNDPKFLPWEGENYVYLPGVGYNYLSVPDEAALDITGDIDIRIEFTGDTWDSNANLPLARKAYSGQHSWNFWLRPSEALAWLWSADGTNTTLVTATAAIPFSAGQRGWVRVTHDVDNGASGNDVKFWSSVDGVTWSQIGATVTTAGVTSIYSGIAEVRPFETFVPGRLHRMQMLNGIDGTTVLDVDTSLVASGSDTSFTARTGQTVTINRSTSGRKSVAVTHPVWLFGTDDYMEVADNDLLDFGASDSFTVLAVARGWNDGLGGTWVAKSQLASSVMTGWVLYWSPLSQMQLRIGDGSRLISSVGNSEGSLGISAGVRNVNSDDIVTYWNGTEGASVTDTTTGSLANAYPLQIGRQSADGGTYADFEFIAAAVFRKALTAGEITTLNNYFQGRVA